MSKRKIFIVGILSVIFIILTVLIMFDKTRNFDVGFNNFIMNFRCSMLDNYFIFITKLGNVAFILGLILGVIIYFRNKEAILYALLAADCTLTNKIISNLYRRVLKVKSFAIFCINLRHIFIISYDRREKETE